MHIKISGCNNIMIMINSNTLLISAMLVLICLTAQGQAGTPKSGGCFIFVFCKRESMKR